MFDLISIGGISIDLYFKGSTLTYKNNRFQLAVGGKYISEKFYTGVGGGGANVAIGVRKHGLKSAVMGKIGNNIFKKIIIEKLHEMRIDYHLCDIEDNYYNVSSILLTPQGERSIVHYVTPHGSLVSDNNTLASISKTKMVYLGNLPDISITQRIELMRFFRMKQIPIVINLGVNDCRRPLSHLLTLLDQANIIVLNDHEFAELVKAPYQDIHFKENVIKWYIPKLSDQVVIVTRGAKGSFAYFNNEVIFQEAINIREITDTTGGGDGFTSGFIAGYIKEGNISHAMKSGALYASKILQKIGAN